MLSDELSLQLPFLSKSLSKSQITLVFNRRPVVRFFFDSHF
jgi:hypothetical protein